MMKKILFVLGVLVVLFAGVNTVAALNSSILDAISGLPLSDQVLVVAKEVDRLKACREMDKLEVLPFDRTGLPSEISLYSSVQQSVKVSLDSLISAFQEPFRVLTYPGGTLGEIMAEVDGLAQQGKSFGDVLDYLSRRRDESNVRYSLIEEVDTGKTKGQVFPSFAEAIDYLQGRYNAYLEAKTRCGE